MGKAPILPDIFEEWLEKQKVKQAKAKPGFVAEEKIEAKPTPKSREPRAVVA